MRKETNKYFLTVEGETEKWYFDWLMEAINTDSNANYSVNFNCKIQKDPLKRAKSIASLEKVEITHIMDKESENEVHSKQFITTLDRMKAAEGLGKKIKYNLGYSNFTFELWMILHKAECNGHLTNRNQYLSLINNAYSENFENLKQYKHENEFGRVLGKLELFNVYDAIKRAKAIMQENQKKNFTLHQYKKYCYYKENPSLSIWEIVDRVMNECFG